MLPTVTTLDDGAAITLAWPDGHTARYHAIWLRDNALDSETRSETNGQRLITLADLPDGLRIDQAEIEDDSVVLHFLPENQAFHFPTDWLRRHCYDKAPVHGRGWVSDALTLWDGALGEALPSADHVNVAAGGAALAGWLSDVHRFGFARLTNGPATPETVLDIAAMFGFVRETNYGRLFDVRTEVNPTNLAYTGLRLQAHTDNPYRDPVPTLQILHCIENSAEGGDSMVVDGFAAARRLQEEDPGAFDVLADHCAKFEFSGSTGVHLETRRPMIELAPDGELIGVRFNNRSAAPITDVPYERMADYYRAYRRFADLIDAPEMQVAFKLAPGDSFIVDNTRVLHARRGYSGAGGRWLQGCYADRDGLMSTLSGLQARGRSD